MLVALGNGVGAFQLAVCKRSDEARGKGLARRYLMDRPGTFGLAINFRTSMEQLVAHKQGVISILRPLREYLRRHVSRTAPSCLTSRRDTGRMLTYMYVACR